MKLIRSLTPEVRIVDAKKGLVDYVASDESLDSYAEVIRAKGWQFTHFAKNAPFVDSHDYSTLERQLGKVVSYEVRDGQLIERVQWAVDVKENKLAQLGWQMTEGGYLKAVSVGFFPVKMASKWGNAGEFNAALSELKLDPATAARVQTIHLQQEQIELSACIIGANPNALAKAHKDGLVSDGQLAGLGFTDDDLTALHHLAKTWETDTSATRAVVDCVLSGIPFRKAKPQPATRADGSAAALEAEQQKRAEFLRNFKAATSI